jgi:hypothetical protein
MSARTCCTGNCRQGRDCPHRAAGRINSAIGAVAGTILIALPFAAWLMGWGA